MASYEAMMLEWCVSGMVLCDDNEHMHGIYKRHAWHWAVILIAQGVNV